MSRTVPLSSVIASFTHLSPVADGYYHLEYLEQSEDRITFAIPELGEEIDLALDTKVDIDAENNTIEFSYNISINGDITEVNSAYKPSKLTEAKIHLPLAYQYTFRIPDKIIVTATSEEEAYAKFTEELKAAAPDLEPVLVGKPKKV